MEAAKPGDTIQIDVERDGELRLYDDKGRMRSSLGGNDEGGYANFYNRKGDLACYVGGDAGAERGYVALYGHQKGKVLELVGTPKGGAVRSLTAVPFVLAVLHSGHAKTKSCCSPCTM